MSKTEEKIGVKYDSEKLKYHLLPPECEAMITAVLTMGSIKYEDDNWKKIEGKEKRYFSAERRHMISHRLGEVFDPESGLPHSAHAIASLIFILYDDIKNNIGTENVMNFVDEKIKIFKENLEKIKK